MSNWNDIFIRLEKIGLDRNKYSNILNKLSRIIEKGWSSSLGVRSSAGASNPSP